MQNKVLKKHKKTTAVTIKCQESENFSAQNTSQRKKITKKNRETLRKIKQAKPNQKWPRSIVLFENTWRKRCEPTENSESGRDSYVDPVMSRSHMNAEANNSCMGSDRQTTST